MTHPIYPAGAGMRDSFPLVFAALPFGVVFGAMGNNLGMSDISVMAMSLLVFAGASQFIAVSLLTAGMSIPVIIATVLVVNLRHMLYGVSLMPIVRNESKWARLFMGFTLTDETFAVVYRRHQQFPQESLVHYYIGSAGFMYGCWGISTAVGIWANNAFPDLTSLGLEMAMVVAFVGIVVPSLKLPSHWICALVAGLSATLTYQWPNQSGLLFSSLIAIGAGVFSAANFDSITSNQGDKHE